MRSLAVLIGGAFGSLARWALGLVVVSPVGGFPVATFAINISGAFGLGVAGVVLTERLPPRRYPRSLIGIGFFGAYTTFSTMAVEGVRLFDAGRAGTAITYWILTLIAGQMAGVYGIWLGRLQFGRREGALDEA